MSTERKDERSGLAVRQRRLAVISYVIESTLAAGKGASRANSYVQLRASVVGCWLINGRETMQIGLAKAAFVKCRLDGPARRRRRHPLNINKRVISWVPCGFGAAAAQPETA